MAVSVLSPLMPSVDTSDMVDDLKNEFLNDKMKNGDDLVDVFSPLSCNDKSTNGGNDSITDDDNRYGLYLFQCLGNFLSVV